MAVLTGLAPDPRQPGYRLLEVDRGRFASLPAADLDLLPLSVGREIPERVVQEALAAEGLDGEGVARAVAERRARQLAGLPPEARRRRLLAFLARRGFSGGKVRELVRELCG